MKSAWMMLVASLPVCLAACNTITPPDSKKEALQRWSSVRSRIKSQVAADKFAAGELDDAQKQLEEALELDPALPEANLLQARILIERGETASAVQALHVARANGATGPETDYLAGLIAQRYGRLDEALSAYRQASGRDPMNAHYVAAVAETLVGLERPAEALRLVQDRWTDFEHNATLRALAGQIHSLLGQYEQAADDYREAVRIASEDSTLKIQFGVALTLAGQYLEAASVLTAAIETDQQPPAFALIALGRAQTELRQFDDAKATLRRATQRFSASHAAWTGLARASLAGGDLLTAREAASRAVQLKNPRPDARLLLAYVCWKQRDLASAADALETLLRERPADALAWSLLADVRAQAGDTEAARECRRRAALIGSAPLALNGGPARTGGAMSAWNADGGGTRDP